MLNAENAKDALLMTLDARYSGMLSKAKVQGAEPLALLMVGSMERGTYVCTCTRTQTSCCCIHV